MTQTAETNDPNTAARVGLTLHLPVTAFLHLNNIFLHRHISLNFSRVFWPYYSMNVASPVGSR